MAPEYQLMREQRIARPIDEVFEFFARPENLEQITPAFLNFRLLTPSPIEMKQGALIDYKLRLFGCPLKWTTHIKYYNPGKYFVDEQLRGPYAKWHHLHEFDSEDDGKVTLIRDLVRYRLPLGWLGKLAHWLLVRHTLRRIFNHRHRAIEAIFTAQRQV